MRIVFFGDLVGEAAIRYLEGNLPRLRRELGADFVVVNGENADLTDPALGKAGMHPETVDRLLACGVDAITGGNHSFDPPWAEELLDHPRVLRPLNLGPHAPGRGYLVLEREGQALVVVNLAGRSAWPPADDPLWALEGLVPCLEAGIPILVDFHSESVFEKLGLAFALDGRVAAVLGTHTHVPTQDLRILPRGTAYVSDVGMVGPSGGMQGYEPGFLVAALRRRLPPRGGRLAWAQGPLEVGAVVVDLEGGRAKGIWRLENLRGG
ncbi:TIGR00282 family metallophosphoesterase [Thermus sediminis]|uniref:TIGR00282 family metallophosphoesterase n=1 Tax=Thermus sediminis TaxID=1761908 RepID=UPI000E3D9221|nr:TIGR00282 family metallophosphoesterase [Thermus sediminis]